MSRASRFSPETRERPVKMVLEHLGGHDSQWSAIIWAPAKLGCTGETLRGWIRQYERGVGKRGRVTTAEKERIRLLEREARQANEIFRKASAHFVQAELDRPFKR